MDIIESLKFVKRRCDCECRLVWWRKEYKIRIMSRSGWVKDFADILNDRCKFRKEHRYVAECENCGKFYFATNSKNDMIKNLKFLEFGYMKKVLAGQHDKPCR